MYLHASCKNVSGVYRRTGYVFTNCHLFVLHCDHIVNMFFKYVLPDTRRMNVDKIYNMLVN